MVGKDKKSEDGILRIVLPVGIGDCEVRPMPAGEFAALVLATAEPVKEGKR